MKDKDKPSTHSALRKKAEKKLLEQRHLLEDLSKEDLHTLTHELGTYQIELEMQNEELRQSQEDLGVERSKYLELYEYAPTGYFTFDKKGLIVEANLTGANLLGVERSQLLNHPFAMFIDNNDRKVFYYYLEDILKQNSLHTCDLRLKRKNGHIVHIQLQSKAVEEKEPLRVWTIVSDITQRKQIEEALRESEERYRSIVDNLQDGYIRANKDGIVIMASPSIAHMYRVDSPQEMLGLPALSLYKNPEDRHALLEELKKRKKVSDFESEALRKDGTSFPVSLNAQFYYDAQGQIQGTEAFVRDSTERKRAENALRESEAFTRLVLNSLFAFVGVMTPDGTLIYVNKAPLEAAGITADEVCGKKFWDAYWWNYDSQVQEQVRAAIERAALGEIARYDVQIRIANDSKMWIDFQIAPLRNQYGRIIHLIPSAMDITQRKRHEEMISHLSALVQSANDAIISKDLNGVIQSWNIGAEKIFGYTAQEAIGRNISFLAPPGHINEESDIIRRIAEGEYIDNFETVRIRKDGTIIHVSLTFSAIKDASDKITGVSKIAHDITDRKLVEEKLKEASEHLEAANEELEAFSYSVSHDLRAPLRHMSGFVDLLQKKLGDQLDETTHKYTIAIATASKKMGMLIDDLLAFSKIGRIEMKRRKISLNPLVRGVVREIKAEAKGRDIVWEIDELPDVYGDRSLLRLALVNLMSNAVKYSSTRSRAEIKIACKDEGSEMICLVKDNGVGFDMQYMDRLFDVFQRLHTQDEFEGTGIGLANVKRIISRHGGRVWAEGAVGQGATFYFTLPKDKDSK